MRAIRNAITGLEKLSDADAASYLNQHPSVVIVCAGMPSSYTAAMVHEARTAII